MTVTPPESESDDSASHTPALTEEVCKALQEYIKMDDEGELEAYDKRLRSNDGFKFKVVNTDTDLSYMVSVEPTAD